MRTPLRERLAAAPITWGVCEVPGWGHQLSADEVLADMAALGFTHTEMGPVGFLPTDGARLAASLDQHGLSLLGGFVTLVLHDPERREVEMQRTEAVAQQMAAAGAKWFVSCPITNHDDWQRPPLAQWQWQHLYEAMSQVDEIVERHGLTQAFHPHVGALIQDDDETRRVLENTQTLLVLDTAHLTLGGSDPRALVDSHGSQIGLVHLKDLDTHVAEQLHRGEMSLMTAVQQGLFPPLGRGSVRIADIIEALESSRPEIWYVLEQDAALDGPGGEALERLRNGVKESVAYVQDCEPAR